MQRSPPGIGEHHCDENEGEHEIDRREQSLPREEAPDRLEFAHPRDGLTGRTRIEIAHRQAQEVGEQTLPELDVDAIGGVGEGVGTQILQDDVEKADRHETGDHHEQGFVAFVGQHLVDDDLEDQRPDQGEDLNEQRGRQHMPERAAVAPQRRQKPADRECLRVYAGSPRLRAIRRARPSVSRASSSAGISVAAWLIGSTSRQRPEAARPA